VIRIALQGSISLPRRFPIHSLASWRSPARSELPIIRGSTPKQYRCTPCTSVPTNSRI
jgi:hypothetical protein